ncbi:MAG: sulfite exporter TauE/SafE family protein [Planctomycetota bacterium]
MIWALLGALAIGLSLGLMGSGGSILTVPVLTLVLGQDEKVAIAGSLAIVGGISLFAGLPYARRRLVDYRSLIFFGLPGMGGSYLGATLAKFVSGPVQLAVFAALMLVAGVMMIRPPKLSEEAVKPRAVWKIMIDGVVVGAITGFVGVGGGFMIVPALVLLGGLPMSRAVGTSLFIIALKSASGFVKYLDVLDELGLALDWHIIGMFTAVGIVGSFAGSAFSKKVPQAALRRVFAVFLFVIGTFIVVRSWGEITGTETAHAAQPAALSETLARKQ